MSSDDLIGYVASALVFLAFYQNAMVPLRVLAVLSNFAFLTYAARLNLMPIIVLHGMLLPINISRLLESLRERASLRSPVDCCTSASKREPILRATDELARSRN